jgi:hypothetical protein
VDGNGNCRFVAEEEPGCAREGVEGPALFRDVICRGVEIAPWAMADFEISYLTQPPRDQFRHKLPARLANSRRCVEMT